MPSDRPKSAKSILVCPHSTAAASMDRAASGDLLLSVNRAEAVGSLIIFPQRAVVGRGLGSGAKYISTVSLSCNLYIDIRIAG